MSKIIYNNTVLGTQLGQDPLVTRSISPIFADNGKRIGIAENYQLVGVITGCSFDYVTGKMAVLNNIFSRDFATLEFADDDGFSVIKSGARINSISYDESPMIGLVNYSVDITCYPESYFENAGILEKRNNWSVSNDLNDNFSISHEIFAKGANTAPNFDNALDNAKNFVLNYTGFNPPSLFPYFISGQFSGSLDSRTESINRLDGSYQITETYVGSTGSKITEELSVDLQSGTDGVITVTVQGNFKGGKSIPITEVRNKYSNFDVFSTATGVYNDYRGITGLFPTPLSSGVTESYDENTLSFNITYNDWPDTFYRHTYSTDISSGNNGIITASINGNIEGLGRLPEKYDRAYNFYTGLDIYGLVNVAYLEYVGPGYPFSLRGVFISSGMSNNRFDGTISYNASFDNRELPLNCSGIKFFDISYNKNPAIRAMSPISIPHSVYGLDIVDLGYKTRATITVDGTVIVEKPFTSIEATGVIARYINGKFAREILASGSKTNIRLDSVNINQNVNEDSASFSVQYSFDEPLSYSTSDYTFITGLFL